MVVQNVEVKKSIAHLT